MPKRNSYTAPRFPEYLLALDPSPSELETVETTRDLLADDPQPPDAYPILFPYEGVWCYRFGRFKLYYIFTPDDITAVTITT